MQLVHYTVKIHASWTFCVARHVPSINHNVYCTNSCFETVASFRLTNVCALCQRLMMLIILINRSFLIKTFLFSMDKSSNDLWMFIFKRLSSILDHPYRVKSVEIQSVIHFIHWETKEMQYSLPLSAVKWNSCFSSIRNRAFCVSPQSLSNNVDVTRNPHANFASFQMGKPTMKFALFYSSRLPDFAELSSAHLIDCYITSTVCNAKYIT